MDARSNALSDRELPVLLESTYVQVDMATAFQEAGREQEGTEIASAIPRPALSDNELTFAPVLKVCEYVQCTKTESVITWLCFRKLLYSFNKQSLASKVRE